MLDKDQIVRHISEGQYPIKESSKFLSRCFVGRYENSLNLPAISIPGGDIGELAILYSASNVYGFNIDYNKALDTYLEVVGGAKNITLHTETKDHDNIMNGCTHLAFIKENPELYDLSKEQLVTIEEQITDLSKKGAQKVELSDRKDEGAMIIITGNIGIYPQYHFISESGTVSGQVYIFHRSFIEARHKVLAQKLLENAAIQFNLNIDEEYLIEALTEISENHFFETVKRLPPHLPLYAVEFDEKNNFVVEKL